MTDRMRFFARAIFPALVAVCCIGCGPKKPELLAESPKGFPTTVGERRLFATPRGYIYARSEEKAGDVDQWLKEVQGYIRREYKRELDRGVVVVMDPTDQPIACTLEEELAIERDPALLPVPPRHPKRPEEYREKMSKDGVPEAAMVRGATIPLTASRLRAMGVDLPSVEWAVAAPSHELAEDCATDVGAGVAKKKKPELTNEQARRIGAFVSGSLVKGFELSRGDPVFVLWAQRQGDWSAEQKCAAILERLKHTLRSNWLPVPKDEELEW
jgi:hypothetical protein